MTPAGNPANLRAAAARKREAAIERVDKAIRQLVRRQQPINFRAVAAEAPCSTGFLYANPELRQRIMRLRDQQAPQRAPREPLPANTQSNIIRTLTAQLAEEKKARREEAEELRQALANAHGEILRLKRSHGA